MIRNREVTFTEIRTYWDLVAIALILVLPLHYLFPPDLREIDVNQCKEGFVEDNAVTQLEEDHFRRKETASEIASRIMMTKNRKSFAIGVLGEYGAGKTSFLNLINLNLDNYVVLKVAFDPWSAGNTEAIRREFFDLLSSEIAAVDSKISSLIYSYGRKLASFDSKSMTWLNWLGFINGHASVQSSGEYQQINKILSATRRKIVITIDDLDRLHPDEIMEVLKLIRNTANFSNFFYLVGYDKAYVQGAIRTLNESGGVDYLDKIFQLEIPLPKREVDDLLVTLRQHLQALVSADHYAVFENVMIPNGFRSRYEKAYSGILRQARDVVRFINGFKIIYKLIGEEVDFQCLLLLELIKFRFHGIYDLIYTQSDLFLYEQPVSATHNMYYTPIMIKDSASIKSSEEISAFRRHIQGFNWLNAEDLLLLDGLFLTLFSGSQYHSPEAKNSISYPLYFEIYFRYRLSQKDLSDKDYKNAIASANMPSYMNYCASHDLHKELMTRLMQEDVTKKRRHFEQVIRWIFVFGRTYVEKEGLFKFDYGAFIHKIHNYFNSITDNLYNKDTTAYRKFISQLFDVAMAPFLFENELIYHLKEKGDNFILTHKELSAHQLSYFTRMAESVHELSEEVQWLFWAARENYKEPAGNDGSFYKRWRFEPELAERMKRYVGRLDPKHFLKFSIERNLYNKSEAMISAHVLEMFSDPSEYRGLIAENPALNDDIKNEYLDFFDKLSEVDFKAYVITDFKTELHKDENG